MNKKLVLSLILVAAIAFLIVTYMSSPKKDNFVGLYGSGKRGCREMCMDAHPEAARMDMDGDNSIAEKEMGDCIAQCEGQAPRGCASCA
jgi:hypothetical protein